MMMGAWRATGSVMDWPCRDSRLPNMAALPLLRKARQWGAAMLLFGGIALKS
jgi:hypothetical protein